MRLHACPEAWNQLRPNPITSAPRKPGDKSPHTPTIPQDAPLVALTNKIRKCQLTPGLCPVRGGDCPQGRDQGNFPDQQ